jgi:hypothetical protein
MEPIDDARYFADYGNLSLEVRPLPSANQLSYEFRVVDKSDGLVCWVGERPSLDAARSSALLEAQIFLDGPTPLAPRWEVGHL